MRSKPLLLYAFRHPVSRWNKENIHQGQCRVEPGLAPEGFAQAEKITELLQDQRIIAIWSSPLPRARQLAETINFRRSPPAPLIFDDNLMEMSHGVIDGVPYTTVVERYPTGWKKWKERITNEPCFPDGTTIQTAAEEGFNTLVRIAKTAVRLRDRCDGEAKAVITSHGARLCFTFAKILNEPLSQALDRNRRLANGSLTVLEWNGDTFAITLYNSVAHLGDLIFSPEVTI